MKTDSVPTLVHCVPPFRRSYLAVRNQPQPIAKRGVLTAAMLLFCGHSVCVDRCRFLGYSFVDREALASFMSSRFVPFCTRFLSSLFLFLFQDFGKDVPDSQLLPYVTG